MKRKNATDMVAVSNVAPRSFDEALEALPADLQPTCRKLHKLTIAGAQSGLRLAYKTGTIIAEALQRLDSKCEQEGRSPYGMGAVDKWAKALGIKARQLYHCKQLAELYSPDEFEMVVQGGHVTWSHMVHLITVDDEEIRQRLEHDVAEKRLSVEQLRQEIQAELGNRRPRSGRSAAKPRNLKDALDRVSQASAKYHNLLAGMLCGESPYILAQVTVTCPDEWTSDLLEKVVAEANTLEQLWDLVMESATTMREVQALGERVLAKRAEQEAAVNAGVDDNEAAKPWTEDLDEVESEFKEADAEEDDDADEDQEEDLEDEDQDGDEKPDDDGDEDQEEDLDDENRNGDEEPADAEDEPDVYEDGYVSADEDQDDAQDEDAAGPPRARRRRR